MPRPRFLLWVSVSILLCALSSFSQDRGSITGVITDPSGAAVPVATVTATNVATGTSQTTQTTSAGFYTVPELPAGIYRVRVEKTGFRIAVADKVEVIVNTATRIDLPLKYRSHHSDRRSHSSGGVTSNGPNGHRQCVDNEPDS